MWIPQDVMTSSLALGLQGLNRDEKRERGAIRGGAWRLRSLRVVLGYTEKW